jgi:hypothetical protein
MKTILTILAGLLINQAAQAQAANDKTCKDMDPGLFEIADCSGEEVGFGSYRYDIQRYYLCGDEKDSNTIYVMNLRASTMYGSRGFIKTNEDNFKISYTPKNYGEDQYTRDGSLEIDKSSGYGKLIESNFRNKSDPQYKLFSKYFECKFRTVNP